MATYTPPSIANYNDNPPSNDGSANFTDNGVDWDRHLDEIGDPLKNYIDAINSEVDATFDEVNKANSLSVLDYGAIGNASTDDTAAIQSTVDAAIALGTGIFFPAGTYKITSAITFSIAVPVTSTKKKLATIACAGCDGFDYAANPASRMTIDGIGFSQSVRHTDTPNTYFAIRLQGSTVARPFGNVLKNLFFDGFGSPIELQWCWDTTITQCESFFCGGAVDTSGLSVNNFFYDNSFSGNLVLFDLGDGAQASEGYFIHDNLLFGLGVGIAIDGHGVSYVKFVDNICDAMGPGTGAQAAIVARSAAGFPCLGWDITNNYVAFSGAGIAGIQLANSVATGVNKSGHKVIGNTIFAYTGTSGSLVRGIYVNGSQEDNNIITGNSCNDGTTADCDLAGGTNTIVTDNQWLNLGFKTTVNCIYANNNGLMITSPTFCQRRHGNITEYWAAAQPSSGTYVAMDYVHNSNKGIDVNNMVLVGWVRLTSGSGHVAGTDWAVQYVSTVSPAS